MFRLFVCYKQQAKKNFFFLQPFSSTFGYIVCVSLRFAPRVDFALHILLYVHQQWIYVWAPLDTFTISFFYLFFHIPIASTFVNLFFLPRIYKWVSESKLNNTSIPRYIHGTLNCSHFFYSTHSTRLSSIYFHASADICYVVHGMLLS